MSELPQDIRLCCHGVVGDEVELGAVAGGERGGLCHRLELEQPADNSGRASLREGALLAPIERRGLIGDAEREHAAHPPSPWRTASISYSRPRGPRTSRAPLPLVDRS